MDLVAEHVQYGLSRFCYTIDTAPLPYVGWMDLQASVPPLTGFFAYTCTLQLFSDSGGDDVNWILLPAAVALLVQGGEAPRWLLLPIRRALPVGAGF